MTWKFTEERWLSCAHWEMMRYHLFFEGHTVSDRKLRLFAAFCLRRGWSWLSENARLATELVERLAEGQAVGKELHQMRPLLNTTSIPGEQAAHWALVTGKYVATAVMKATQIVCALDQRRVQEGREKAHAFRDIVGSPFRPVPFDQNWRSPAVKAIAGILYEERILPAGTLQSDLLAILADALEDAGCGNTEILDHLRGPGPHVQGCFAVDMALARS